MTKLPTPAPAAPLPASGGSFVRDKSGALVPENPPAASSPAAMTKEA
ncbi:hypothetical protein [Tabrizicola fusiformis]|nr:hypothetical protein [Tabrizicola sp. SY72]NTT86921.1 hypothetical protein [Tabrizicola sp. SY72]